MKSLLLILLLIPSVCFGYDGVWYDANKKSLPIQDDSKMCWAAAAANAVFAAQWDKWLTDEQQLFDMFVEHFDNTIGWPTHAWDALFDYYDELFCFGNPWEKPEYVILNPEPLIEGIIDLLENGYGVVLALYSGGPVLHLITAWGIEDSILYYTNSDDGVYGLREAELFQEEDGWYIRRNVLDSKIYAVVALPPFDWQTMGGPVPVGWQPHE